MARQVNRLSARRVATVRSPGYYADGGNLWLQVSPSGSKSWIFRFTLNGRSREMGLGSVDTFTLTEARERATDCRKQLDAGIDPIETRKAKQTQRRLEDAKSLTFAQCAERYIAAHRAKWENAKHAAQWESTLATYADPFIGRLPVQAVDTDLVMRVLQQVDQDDREAGPLWTAKPETASRLRGRIESVLDWATTLGLRAGDNPARWRGHLENLLPPPSKIRTVRHHPSLPYAELPAFMAKLRALDGIGARALEFTVVTAARTGEVIGAEWAEFDLEAKIWTVPAERMKMKREHRVPLSPRAIELLEALKGASASGYVFRGLKRGKPLSNAAMAAVIDRMHASEIATGGRGFVDPKQGGAVVVPHGFRSTFSDWVAERTAFPWEVREAALAHVKGDKVEAAYQRGDLFEKRQRLMNEWARYCGSDPADAGAGTVVPIDRQRAAA